MRHIRLHFARRSTVRGWGTADISLLFLLLGWMRISFHTLASGKKRSQQMIDFAKYSAEFWPFRPCMPYARGGWLDATR
jgi:hypothetical protein